MFITVMNCNVNTYFFHLSLATPVKRAIRSPKGLHTQVENHHCLLKAVKENATQGSENRTKQKPCPGQIASCKEWVQLL